MYTKIQKLALKDCRCPRFLRRADSHAHKTGSVVRQDGCRGAKLQNCLPEHLHGFRSVASLNTPYPATSREASFRYAIRFRSLMRRSFMTCRPVCHMALEYYRSNLTHLRFFAFTGHDFQPVFFHYAVYGATAYVFVCQCIGNPPHPRTVSSA